MNNENICLPKISNNIFDFQKGDISKVNTPLVDNYSNINKIIKN